jgi:4-aminobutyrate aminotransferase-like enzyme/Ser/Thr protein kinase RdoA (MazF antagonist)
MSLPALRTARMVPSAAEAARIAREVHGIDAVAESLGGERDCNFRLRGANPPDLVLKILGYQAEPAGADEQLDLECQIRVLRHLQQRDPALSVPRLVAAAKSSLLLSFLEGQPLAGAAGGASLLRHLGATLARVDRALQGFFDPALARPLAWDLRRLPELAAFIGHLEPERLRRTVQRTVDGFEERSRLFSDLRSQAIHGDCHAHNVLVDPAGLAVVGILDFGDIVHAPLLFEPAVAMSELLTEGIAPVEVLASVLQGFVTVQALQAVEVDLLLDVVKARHAAVLLVHAWRRRHDRAGAGLLEAAAARAANSLEILSDGDCSGLTAAWHDAAGTLPAATQLAKRRRQLLGVGAELFYDEPLHIVRGEDVWLYDAGGRRYLDVYNNVPHVGHAHPCVVAAVHRQTAALATHTRYLHELILEYAEQLTTRLRPDLNACIFVNSGSEANDVAWRIAQAATGAKGALIMDHAYHGVTDAVSALTPAAAQRPDSRVATLAAPCAALSADALPSGADLAAAAGGAERALGELRERGVAPAAFFLDSAFTSNGILDPPPAWLDVLVARIRAAGALVVGDEVQYGLGRSGSHYWGFERRGLAPDIVTLGKPAGNGFPLGVVITRREIVEEFQAKSRFFSTFGGNAVAAAAGVAVLQVLEREQLQANAQATGSYLRTGLETLALRHACLGRVRGCGLLLGLEIVEPPAGLPAPERALGIVNALARAGILTGVEGPRGNVLKLRPPMTFRREHADLLLAAVDTAVAATSAAREWSPVRR